MTPETPLDHDSCTECVAAVTPVPDSEMLDGELVALLLTVMLPLADPFADGANVEVSVVVCPGARMIPLALLELKPAPATRTNACQNLCPAKAGRQLNERLRHRHD